MSPTAENIAKVREFLDARVSLGWTDLDQAFAAVLKEAPADAQIVYIGDGIVTAGETDPASFVKRLGRMIDAADAKGEKSGRAFHAVTVGNTYEAMVLRGIAEVGHGSVRNIGGERTPQAVALELLNELTQPGLRDINVEFRGVKVAAVYPEHLPSLPAGTQQILVGRYLPTGADQQGEVIVTAKRDGEPVRYAAKINLKDAEEGNSFIPRLWAREHLDHLLAQGPSESIRDQIIALSEEFHIITPYTSLLVLESDADRERFGVKKRFLMRDGERFFAEGRDNANFELLQQQMKRAGDWRLRLRYQILRELAGLGRDPRAFQAVPQLTTTIYNSRMPMFGPMAGPMTVTAPMSGAGYYLVPNTEATIQRYAAERGEGTLILNGINSYHGTTTVSGGSLFFDESGMLGDKWGAESESSEIGGSGGIGGGGGGGFGGQSSRRMIGGWAGDDVDFVDRAGLDDKLAVLNGDFAEIAPSSPASGLDGYDSAKQLEWAKAGIRDEEMDLGLVKDEAANTPLAAYGMNKGLWQSNGDSLDFGQQGQMAGENYVGNRFQVAADLPSYEMRSREIAYTIAKPVYSGWRNPYWAGQQYTAWLDTLFPALAAPPPAPAPEKKPRGWSADAIALSKSLLRTESLQKLDGGLELARTTEMFDARWNRTTSHSSDLVLYSPAAWLVRPRNVADQTIVNYCNDKERDVFSLAFLLGRTRKSTERDLKTVPFQLTDSSLVAIHTLYGGNSRAKVEPAGEKQAHLVITFKDSKSEVRLLVDTARHVVLKQEWLADGKVTSTTIFSDFVEVGGGWWARDVETTDAKDQKTSETKLNVKSLASDAYSKRLEDELAAKPRVQFLNVPGVTLKDARQHVADGSAGFDDRITMILYECLLQQWDEVMVHLEAAEKLDGDKPGVQWLRPMILQTIRRDDEARKSWHNESQKLAENHRQDEVFLAEFILGQVGGVASPAEVLEFVQMLKPVYDRQPAELDLKARWTDHLIGCYEGMARTEEALKLRRELAEQMPWDIGRQIDYARRLLQQGHSQEAYDWVQKELDRPIAWSDNEDEQLCSALAEFYRTEVRWDDLLHYTSEWIKREPPYQAAYQQHLSALVYNDQLSAADDLVEKWLKDSQIEGKLKPSEQARLDTAVSFALGNCWNLNFNQNVIDPRWQAPLLATLTFFAGEKDHFDVVSRIANDYRFSQTEAMDKVRGFALAKLQSDLEKLAPDQVSNYVNWAISGRVELEEPMAERKQLDASEVPASVWKNIADQLHTRWQATNDRIEKNTLSEALRTIYSNRFNETELLPFLRERIKAAEAEKSRKTDEGAADDNAAQRSYRLAYISALFDALVGRSWTEENEKEAFSLLPQLSDSDDATGRLLVEVPALYRLVDGMVAERQVHDEQELRDKGNVNELTRTELAKKKAEFAKDAKTAVSARLAEESKPYAAERADAFARALLPWLRIEQAYLDVQLNQNLENVEEQCWTILGEMPPKPKELSESDAGEQSAAVTINQLRQDMLDAVLRQRAFITMMNLAARRNAKEATINRTLKYIDAGMEQGKERAALWRAMKYQLLVALDRPDELEQQLRAWVRSDESTSPWRKPLALLLAERGQLDEAIKLFEVAEKDQLLIAGDYTTLANWYLVKNRRDDYERARVEAYKRTPENLLNQRLWQVRERWMRNDLPPLTELDDNTLFTIRALLEKSAQPSNYFWELRMLYEACRDFRLLQAIPDGVLGRTPEQIYPYLQNVQSQILSEMNSEATADEIIARIKKLRERKLTTIDQRALDLMEAMVERRSSEVLNQPGPHIEACVAALKRAFDRKWGEHEPVLMAGFLASLGKLPHQPMIDEQLRELRVLQSQAAGASRDHLTITNNLCNLLAGSYEKHDQAIEEMQAEVRTYDAAHGGKWPEQDNNVLSDYVHLYEQVNRDAAGEAVLQKYLASPETDQQRNWLTEQLLELYNHALDHDCEVSLGVGNTLFLNLLKHEEKLIEKASDENVRLNIVQRMCATFGVAHQHKFTSTEDEMKKFAFETIPAVLKRQQSQYSGTATAPVTVVRDVLGPREALRYIVERMEQYPQWLNITWNSAWNSFGYELAERRRDVGQLGDLEPRVLKLVVGEIKRDLRTRQARNRMIYTVDSGYFWADKQGDFGRAAEDVYNEVKTSGRGVQYVADYLWTGLHDHSRAIEMMLVAHKQGLLDEGMQEQLVNWLQERSRYGESIAILEPLVELRPDAMHYRAQLMVAYYHTKRSDQLDDLVKQTDKHFHEGGRWTEGNIAEFGKACLDSKLFDKASGYLNEAISLHHRANGGVVVNDQWLSEQYQHLSDAEAALFHTKEAVDAASGAIVCWGNRQDKRQEALNNLRQVLERSRDLGGYIDYLDKEAAKTGEDSPILRKAIGEVYRNRSKYDEAIKQFELAAALAPNDKEVCQALVECYDKSGNKADATKELLTMIGLDPHNFKLYEQLAERVKSDPAEAERAVTSIVEVGAQEAENHTALAEIRQKQGRWDAAIDQWKDVARLRALEPTGLINLAEAQIHQKQWDAARETIEKLQHREWPARFGDVNNQIRPLQAQLPK